MRKNKTINSTHWKTKYAIGLGLIALVLIGGQFVVRNFLESQKFDLAVLHTANQQRLLCQSIAKHAFALSQYKDEQTHIPILQQQLKRFQEAHANLTQQSNSLGFHDGNVLAPRLKKLYDSLQPYYNRLVVESENLWRAVAQKDSAKRTIQTQDALTQIIANEAPFEILMDKIIDEYEAEDATKLARVRWAEWAMLILSILGVAMAGFFIFRPIIQRADNAIGELRNMNQELGATEEEVRQNLEEMKSIQDSLELAYSEAEAMDLALNRGTIVSVGDLKGNILKVNEAFCAVTQYSEDELIGKNHNVVNSGHHSKEFWIDLWKTISKGGIWHGEIKNRAKDGSFYWVDAVISPVFDKKGKIVKYLSVRTLITDKKEAEEALRNANEELYQSMETLKSTQEAFQRSYADMQAMMTALNDSAIVSVGDLKGNIIFANDEFCRVSQYSREEVLGKNHSIVNSGYHSHEFWKEMWRTVGKGGTWESEVKNKAKDGSFYWVHAVVTPVYDNHGKIYKYFSVRTLITERKEAEERLQQTKERLEQTAQIARVGFWNVDLEHQTIVWSDIAREIHEVGKDFEPNIATGITFFKKGESRAKMSAMMSKSIQDGTPWDLELQIVTAKGREVWVRTRGQVEFRAGEPVRLFGTFQDIDEKKRNELNIKKLANIVESSEDAIYSLDLNYNVTSWNKGAENIFGYSADEMLHNPQALLKIFPTQAQIDEENNIIAQVRAGYSLEHLETIRQTKTGNTIFIAVSVSPIFDADGTVIGVSKIARDITSKKKAQEELKQKNEDIISSITYAQRIQSSILPLPEEMSQALPQHFIFFKPRDIVSGDFYYLQEIQQKTILAVVDCTGHGVPGALMTMLGNETLNDIILNHETTEPDQILNELHKKIRKTLKQAETQNRDGMDLSMIVWDKQAQTVSFAGAKNPLVYVLRGEVYTLKADSFGIGGEQLEEERIFTKQTIDLHDIGEVTFYLFSDGYQDQFGGERNKKFGLKRMKQLFLEMHTWQMPEQHAYLAEQLATWQEVGKEKQIDDVLVVGIQI